MTKFGGWKWRFQVTGVSRRHITTLLLPLFYTGGVTYQKRQHIVEGFLGQHGDAVRACQLVRDAAEHDADVALHLDVNVARQRTHSR